MWIQLNQTTTWLAFASKRTGLSVMKAFERGGTAQQGQLWTLRPGTLPVLMDVTKHNAVQILRRNQQLTEGFVVQEIHRIQHRITDGDRWMVQGDEQGFAIPLPPLKMLL